MKFPEDIEGEALATVAEMFVSLCLSALNGGIGLDATDLLILVLISVPVSFVDAHRG